MAELFVRSGSCSAQGRRPNNEDRHFVGGQVFIVADGMGGQDCGEVASGLATSVLSREIAERLSDAGPEGAIRQSVQMAHAAILDEGKRMPTTRRMGTTVVLAVLLNGRALVTGVGDSPALLARGGACRKLTEDHTIADALARKGTISPEQAKHSPYRNVLYKFLGCAEWTDGVELTEVAPEPGDRIILATDGLTGVVDDAEVALFAEQHSDPQACAEGLVKLALDRGSKDNVTCIVLAFGSHPSPSQGERVQPS
jgi:protein phosphatase